MTDQSGQTTAVRRVCITFQPLQPWLRPVMQGIRQYLQQHQLDWDLLFTRYGEEIHPGELDQGQEVDGILGEYGEAHVPDTAGPPTVLVEVHATPVPTLHQVGTDMIAVGRIAAEHLIERGYRSFAALTTHHAHAAADLRITGYCQTLQQAGYDVPVFRSGTRTAERGYWRFEDQIADLTDLLRDRPRPMGLFAVDVNQAWRGVMACHRATLRVPDDVAIICGGNDDILFDNLRPTISGIQYNSTQVGYEAARMLDALMNKQATRQQILIPPRGPIVRQSSDFLAIDDHDVHTAVRFIWQHVDQPMTVQRVAEHVLVSPRTLSRKFQQVLGRGPSQEIRRAKVETAKRLLLTTELPLLRVALEAGFVSQAQLCRYIRQDTGYTPTQLRYGDRVASELTS